MSLEEAARELGGARLPNHPPWSPSKGRVLSDSYGSVSSHIFPGPACSTCALGKQTTSRRWCYFQPWSQCLAGSQRANKRFLNEWTFTHQRKDYRLRFKTTSKRCRALATYNPEVEWASFVALFPSGAFNQIVQLSGLVCTLIILTSIERDPGEKSVLNFQDHVESQHPDPSDKVPST